jgi:hypothetical protein
MPGGAALSRKRLDEWTEKAREHGAAGLLWIKTAGGEITSPAKKALPPGTLEALLAKSGAADGDLLLMVADSEKAALASLAALRAEAARELKLIAESGKDEDKRYAFCWVTEFPLLGQDEHGNWFPMNHPFTAPREEDLERLETSGSVRARVRRRGQRLGARVRLDTHSPRGPAGARLPAFTPASAGREGRALRLPAGGAAPRRAAHGGIRWGSTSARSPRASSHVILSQDDLGHRPDDEAPAQVFDERLAELGLRAQAGRERAAASPADPLAARAGAGESRHDLGRRAPRRRRAASLSVGALSPRRRGVRAALDGPDPGLVPSRRCSISRSPTASSPRRWARSKPSRRPPSRRAPPRRRVRRVGGGVVTDVAGFAAAVLLRGVAWNAVPAATAGMADAAIGGKTAVSHSAARISWGRFTAAAVSSIRTLPDITRRDYRAGLVRGVQAACRRPALAARAAAPRVRCGLRTRRIGASGTAGLRDAGAGPRRC